MTSFSRIPVGVVAGGGQLQDRWRCPGIIQVMDKDFLGVIVLQIMGEREGSWVEELPKCYLKFEYVPSALCAGNAREKRCQRWDPGKKVKAESSSSLSCSPEKS